MNIKYTPQAIQALEGAEDAARQFNHAYLGTEHIQINTACRRLLIQLLQESLSLRLKRIARRDVFGVFFGKAHICPCRCKNKDRKRRQTDADDRKQQSERSELDGYLLHPTASRR